MVELEEREATEAVADKEAAETAAHAALMKEANMEVLACLLAFLAPAACGAFVSQCSFYLCLSVHSHGTWHGRQLLHPLCADQHFNSASAAQATFSSYISECKHRSAAVASSTVTADCRVFHQNYAIQSRVPLYLQCTQT